MAVLKQLAQLVGTKPPTRKGDLVQFIQKKLEDTGFLKECVERLSPLQRNVIAEILYSPSGAFDRIGFTAKYGEVPAWGRLSSYYGWGSDKPEPNGLDLLIYGNQIPKDLAARLKDLVSAPVPVKVKTKDDLPETVTLSWREYDFGSRKESTKSEDVPLIRADTERAAQQDLMAILRLVQAGKIRVSQKTLKTTAASVKAITKVLYAGDFYPPPEGDDPWETEPTAMKAFAWPLLLQAAGLVAAAGTKLELTTSGLKALTAPAHRTIKTVWSRWLKATMLDEFNRVHTIKGQTGKGKRHLTAPAKRRAVIAKALQNYPSNQWVLFDDFSRYMRSAGHRFEIVRGDPWHLYISDSYYGHLGYDGFAGWNILQDRYLLTFLFEYTATLGLIDVAYISPSGARTDYGDLWGVDDLDCLSQYDGLMYLRLNNLGAWCLGLADGYEPSAIEETQTFRVLPNHDVVAVVPPPAGDVLFLELFTSQSADCVWKLDPAKLLKTLEEGHKIEQIQTFLAAKSGTELPDNVVVFLNDVAIRASQLQDLGTGRIIKASDPALAKLIVSDTRLAKLCILAGEDHVVVPTASEAAFRRELRRLGYGLQALKE